MYTVIHGRLKTKHNAKCPACKMPLTKTKKIKFRYSTPRTILIYHCYGCFHNYCLTVDYEFLKKYPEVAEKLNLTFDTRNSQAQTKKHKKIKCDFIKDGYCVLIAGPCNRYSPACNRPLKYTNPYSVPPHYNPVYLADNSSVADTTKRKYTKHNISEERYGSNSIPKSLKASESPKEVSVFGGALNLPKEQVHDYYIIATDIMNPNIEYPILVAYYIPLQRYYLSHTQLQRHIKMGHHLNLKLHISNAGTESLDDFSGFNLYSVLSLYGYHVGLHGKPEFQRRKILSYIIDNEILHKWQIIEMLNGNISLRNGRADKNFSTAIKQWEDDIMFVEEYNQKTQEWESAKCLKCGRSCLSTSRYCFQCLKDMNDAEI